MRHARVAWIVRKNNSLAAIAQLFFFERFVRSDFLGRVPKIFGNAVPVPATRTHDVIPVDHRLNANRDAGR